ncbi:uncharacterized protein J4E79_006724 [Alternaria viburni]|uniref:uncharacterized protein n=1 Tax=Alternaria viburni TaxID=566460 RepID=UPI0020C28477|nr:uncharacterized protein J4E79_006724 [Alternaria viburni]KAI4658964.1 hypothetical protein J4E79_006724 [Alternaria viburni]
MPIRSTGDKEVEAVDLDRLFEQYVETDLLNHFNDRTPKQSTSDNTTHHFESSLSNGSECFGPEPILDRETQAAWHKALEKYAQNATSFRSDDPASSFYVTSSSGIDSRSDSELLSFEDLFELERNHSRSTSQPPTSRPHPSGRSVKKTLSSHGRPKYRGITKSTKRPHPSVSAKMMQSSHFQSTIADAWTRKTDSPTKSSARASSHGIASPPLSSNLDQQERNNGGVPHNYHQAYTNDYSSLPNDRSNYTNYQLTPSASPAMGNSSNSDSGFNANMGLAYCSSSTSSAALSALQTPPPSLQLPVTTWGPDPSPALDLSFSASCDTSNSLETAGWWNENDPTVQPPYSTSFGQSNLRSTSHNVRLEGLGISYDSAAFDFGAMNDSYSTPRASASFDMASYGAMYNRPSHHYAQPQVPSTSQPVSRSPSPRVEPRFHRSKSSSHHRSSQSSRRKSNHSSQQSSRQTSVNSGGVGFVNFTPDDSRKILTGVAPSGSSKTKARREKEAADKRRKLSRAAMKAVIEAGGDIDSLRRLEREGLLVMEG